MPFTRHVLLGRAAESAGVGFSIIDDHQAYDFRLEGHVGFFFRWVKRRGMAEDSGEEGNHEKREDERADGLCHGTCGRHCPCACG